MTIKDLKEAYGTAFEPLLKELNISRVKVWVGMIVSMVCAVLTLSAMSKNAGFLVITMHLLITATAGLQTWYTYQTFRKQFKTRVVRAVLHFINPEYKYFYEHHHSLKEFMTSGLYSEAPNQIKGEDFVSGMIKDYHFEMSEINASHKSQGSDGLNIFKGLFIQVDWPWEFTADTYLFPGKSDQPLTDFFRNKSLKKKSLKVLIEDSDFSESYTVYGDSPGETRALLTTELREALVKFDKRFFSDTYISFVGKKAYCAVAYESILFEPTLWDVEAFPSTIMDLYRQTTIVNKFLEVIELLTPPTQELANDKADSKETVDITPTVTPLPEVQEPADEMVPVREEIPSEIVIASDVQVNLKELYYDLIIDLEHPPELDLKQYLLALIGKIELISDQELTQDSLRELLIPSLSATAKEMDMAWLDLRSSPDPKVKYQQVNDMTELETLEASDFAWQPLAFTLAVLQFQVAELHKMAGNQLENPMKGMGIASDTGTHWYNFAPKDNLEAGIRYLINTHGIHSKPDWSIIGQIFQAGRAYE